MFRFAFIVLLILYITPICIQAQNSSLKILSWNIYMLPRFIKNTGKIERAQQIGSYLKNSDYDVIVFQEAFHSKARKIIGQQLNPLFPYSAGPANRQTFSLSTNSGLWILSKYPISQSKAIKFTNRCGIDAFSRKGALLVELDVNGKKVQVVDTHLQSCGPEWIRQSQCVELSNKMLIPLQKNGVPQIVCGDFNINKYADLDYACMLQNLDVIDEDFVSDQKFTYDHEQNDLIKQSKFKIKDLIDYIFVKTNKSQTFVQQKKIKIIQSEWHMKHKDLSDHYAIEAVIQLQDIDTTTVNIQEY